VRSPGKLVASGRDSDIYECGPGLVLRRARGGRSMAVEARTMEFARAQGYPVPAIEELDDSGRDLVMERIDGPSMMSVLGSKPWLLRSQAQLLAGLHHRLHAIEAPAWLPAAPGSSGSALVHLDLHPLNVMMGPWGPVVIDWPNAAHGDPAADVAMTWALLSGAAIPGSPLKTAVLGRFRSVFVRSFLRRFPAGPVRRELPAVVAFKTRDANLSAEECRAMEQLAVTRGTAG
jgi:Phosphotransferase enzyme family